MTDKPTLAELIRLLPTDMWNGADGLRSNSERRDALADEVAALERECKRREEPTDLYGELCELLHTDAEHGAIDQLRDLIAERDGLLAALK